MVFARKAMLSSEQSWVPVFSGRSGRILRIGAWSCDRALQLPNVNNLFITNPVSHPWIRSGYTVFGKSTYFFAIPEIRFGGKTRVAVENHGNSRKLSLYFV